MVQQRSVSPTPNNDGSVDVKISIIGPVLYDNEPLFTHIGPSIIKSEMGGEIKVHLLGVKVTYSTDQGAVGTEIRFRLGMPKTKPKSEKTLKLCLKHENFLDQIL